MGLKPKFKQHTSSAGSVSIFRQKSRRNSHWFVPIRSEYRTGTEYLVHSWSHSERRPSRCDVQQACVIVQKQRDQASVTDCGYCRSLSPSLFRPSELWTTAICTGPRSFPDSSSQFVIHYSSCHTTPQIISPSCWQCHKINHKQTKYYVASRDAPWIAERHNFISSHLCLTPEGGTDRFSRNVGD